eukprot:9504123-Pyramimonas_sp.AAC.2
MFALMIAKVVQREDEAAFCASRRVTAARCAVSADRVWSRDASRNERIHGLRGFAAGALVSCRRPRRMSATDALDAHFCFLMALPGAETIPGEDVTASSARECGVRVGGVSAGGASVALPCGSGSLVVAEICSRQVLLARRTLQCCGLRAAQNQGWLRQESGMA